MGSHADIIRFSVRPTAPFRLDLTVWTLRRRSINAIDAWDGTTYRRILPLDGEPVLVAVTQQAKALDVSVSGTRLPPDARKRVTHAVERLLGIRKNLDEFYALASGDTRLHDLSTRFRGFKPPRFATVFEGVVNGISCQQLSLTVGIILLNRLAERCGMFFEPGVYAFPRPEDIAPLSPEDLRALGYSGNKARALIGVAQSIADGHLDLEELDGFDNRQCVGRLSTLGGVGRWTAEYVLLRSLGRIDVFPGDDVGGQNGLARWRHTRTKLDYERVQKLLSKWKNYDGMIFFLLLLKGLEEAGEMNRSST